MVAAALSILCTWPRDNQPMRYGLAGAWIVWFPALEKLLLHDDATRPLETQFRRVLPRAMKKGGKEPEMKLEKSGTEPQVKLEKSGTEPEMKLEKSGTGQEMKLEKSDTEPEMTLEKSGTHSHNPSQNDCCYTAGGKRQKPAAHPLSTLPPSPPTQAAPEPLKEWSWAKAIWAFELLFNPRGIGWTHETASSLKQRATWTPESRKGYVRRQLLLAIWHSLCIGITGSLGHMAAKVLLEDTVGWWETLARRAALEALLGLNIYEVFEMQAAIMKACCIGLGLYGPEVGASPRTLC